MREAQKTRMKQGPLYSDWSDELQEESVKVGDVTKPLINLEGTLYKPTRSLERGGCDKHDAPPNISDRATFQ